MNTKIIPNNSFTDQISKRRTPYFGPALDKNKTSTTRPEQGFFSGQKSVDHFLASHEISSILTIFYPFRKRGM